MSWRDKFDGFIAFLTDYCSAGEREAYLRPRGGPRLGRSGSSGGTIPTDDTERSGRTLANVQVATGETQRATRARLMRAFNTPFFPDILVCSEVMGEGVDLQRFCRHVIHHDLAWNPSIIEQRTGRIDRIGCKAEGRQPIVLYLPYIAGAADERQYPGHDRPGAVVPGGHGAEGGGGADPAGFGFAGSAAGGVVGGVEFPVGVVEGSGPNSTQATNTGEWDMELVGFSVSKYRSIINAHRLPVSSSTVLIGKNNEGKSNLLAALAAAMAVVNQLGEGKLVAGRLRGAFRMRDFYEWERDFPIQLQSTQPNGESVFRLEFRLTEVERTGFRKEVHSNLNEDLPVEIRIGRGDPLFKVMKKGPGSAALNKKREAIAAFIGSRVEFTYIPAVRTAEAALDVVRRMVDQALRTLQARDDYRAAVAEVAELQRPIMEQMSTRIGDALREFLPSIKSVTVDASEDARFMALRRSVDVVIDDGTPTSLQRKGDGVQSLAAISLLRGINPTGKDLILALEEPESHLHPSAIHRLRKLIRELARQHQIVLSTHCPLFVDRVDVGSNIVVAGNRATPARSIGEVRDLLGVRASDNLRHASLVLLVEGESDCRILTAVLTALSTGIREALDNNTLAVEALRGAGKLNFKLSELQNAICEAHCFLDNDDAGRAAVGAAMDAGLLEEAQYHLAAVPGRASSELEDLIDRRCYEECVAHAFGVDLSLRSFRGRDPWTHRVAATFRAQGKVWDATVEKHVKTLVADRVVGEPSTALAAQSVVVQSLVQALERRIKGDVE